MNTEVQQMIDDITDKGLSKATDLINILSIQQGQKKDFVAPTDTMKMKMRTSPAFEGQEPERILELNFDDIRKDEPNIRKSMQLTDHGHKQMAEKTDIPKRYYERMLNDNELGLLAANVNTWIDTKEHRFVRTMGGKVRAILSDRYLVLDHLKAIAAATEKAKEHRAVLTDCKLTDTRLYVKMVVPHETWEIKKDDHHVRGIVFSNSEVGAGSFKAEPFVMRLLCSNGMIGMDTLSRVHLGSKMSPGMYVSTHTQELEVDLVASKCQDIVEAVFNREKFDRWMESYRMTTEVRLNSPVDATKNVIGHFKLGEKEETSLLNALIGEGDPTQYGLVNAVTSHARTHQNPMVSIELEKVAGEISVMSEKKFQDTINIPVAAVA